MPVYSLFEASVTRRGKVLYDSGFDPLDGDFDKVVVIDHSDDGGAPVDDFMFDSGRPVDLTCAPSAWRYKAPGHQKPMDVMGCRKGTHMVSPRFRDLVERLEPGRHQFHPAHLRRKSGPVGEYFWLIVGSRLDGLAHALCEPPLDGRRTYRLRQEGVPWRRVFDAEKIAGHHIWRERHQGGLFVSAALAGAFEQGLFEGHSLSKPFEVHPAET